MPKKLTSALGVDIGSRSIKVAEIKVQGGAPVVTALGWIDTPENAVDHTGVYNAEAVGDALKTLLANSGATVKDIVVSIQGQSSVLVRTLEVNRMSEAELKEHMAWELSRNNPFAEANPAQAYAVIPGDNPASQNMDVVMAIASPHAVDTLVQAAKRAGRQASVMDVEPLGLARSIETTHGNDYRGQIICAVNIGHKTTSINIFRDGNLLMTRQVPVGGENFTKAISLGMSVVVAEAEQLKLEEADLSAMGATVGGGAANPFGGGGALTQEFTPYNPFADNPLPADEPAPAPAPAAPVAAGGNRVNTALAGELDEFVAEIRRSIEYFRSRGSDVNRLLLTGGGSQIKGFVDFLGSALGIPCDAYEPLERLSVQAKKADPAFLEAHRREFAVAVGNGLHILF